MIQGQMTIGELARRAGVSVRTIRYYLAEGLLPAPETDGRYSVFGPEYLARLKIIQRLKDAYLPLKEIRAKIDTLSREEVTQLLQSEAPASPQQAAVQPFLKEAPATSAMEYINNLMGRPRPTHQPPTQPLRPPQPATDTWQRIYVAPGVEIHIEQGRQPHQADRIQKLLAYARQLFSQP